MPPATGDVLVDWAGESGVPTFGSRSGQWGSSARCRRRVLEPGRVLDCHLDLVLDPVEDGEPASVRNRAPQVSNHLRDGPLALRDGPLASNGLDGRDRIPKPSSRHARPGERARLWTESLQRPTLAPPDNTRQRWGTLGSSHDRQSFGWCGRHHRRAGGRRPGWRKARQRRVAKAPWRSPPRTGSSSSASSGSAGSTSGSSPGRGPRQPGAADPARRRLAPTRCSPCPCGPGSSTSRSCSGTTGGGQDPRSHRQGQQRGDDLRPQGRRRRRAHRVPPPASGHRQGGGAGRVDGHPDRPAPGPAPARPAARLGGHRPVREHGRQRGPQVAADPGAAAGGRQ